MTNGSLTDMHAIVSTPLLLNSSTREMNPGRCDSEHVGVIAPGTPHTTTCVYVRQKVGIAILYGISGRESAQEYSEVDCY
jgi:hypothetical protein